MDCPLDIPLGILDLRNAQKTRQSGNGAPFSVEGGEVVDMGVSAPLWPSLPLVSGKRNGPLDDALAGAGERAAVGTGSGFGACCGK